MQETKEETACYHCGEPCLDAHISHDKHQFCCQGCKAVYTLLHDTGLVSYYEIDQSSPGATIRSNHANKDFLDLDEVKRQLIDFSEGSSNKVTFYLPTMHCAACIWLLEKLERLNKGVYRSDVNFLRKELTVHFNADHVSLKEVVILLEDLGYPPDLQRDKFKKSAKRESNKLLIKLGVAGFAFGNIMLFSFPEYLSLDDASLTSFKVLFGYLNLLLAIPVLVYADVDYLKSAWQSLKFRYLTIDVPIALGIITLFGRSAYEVLSGTGAGYFDSFAGLIFFLLIGKWYQGRTYEALAFDRDFKSYFPIAVSRIVNGEEEVCMIEKIEKGDRLKILNNQVIPADAVLIRGHALVDYSFVNGESDLVEKQEGDYLYAGGRQSGGAIEVEVVKAVSQSYLTGLWNQDAFTTERNPRRFALLIDKVSRVFSIGILTIAALTLMYWLYADPAKAADAFTAVLIIACPCALALSMPFATGNVSRILGKLGFFVKNAATLEQMAQADAVVFDKTGTLTRSHSTRVKFEGKDLSEHSAMLIKSAAANSTHPLSVSIRNYLNAKVLSVDEHEELAGKGTRSMVQGVEVRLGSPAMGELPPDGGNHSGHSVVHVWLNKKYAGRFIVEKDLRKGVHPLVKSLQERATTYLLSGDHEGERGRMASIFGSEEHLRFNQSPMDKLSFVKQLQAEGRRVMMLGDGLNDAGALKQADVGIAVADDVFSFSPACDAILRADQLPQLNTFISYIRKSLNVVKASVVISLLYNVVGLYFAVRAELTPIVAAILMPLSSVTVVVFITLLTEWLKPKT